MTKKIKAVIIGASGYTGAETVRLLHLHPQVELVALVAESNAGQPIEAIYPHLATYTLPPLIALDALDWSGIDVAFLCLPHGLSQKMVGTFPKSVKIIDLSADFRLSDAADYQTWYHEPHVDMATQKEAVYGLVEVNRETIKKARVIAVPGCYPTSATLPLVPLIKAGIIEASGIIIDSKSGITGAGRSAKVANLFCEMNESVKSYGIGTHRHIGEIEQTLSIASGSKTQVSFTPQVVPMSRGILSNIYVNVKPGKTLVDIKTALQNAYVNEPFVHVANGNHAPSTREVTGTNYCVMNAFESRLPGQIIIVSVIDNLLKGASGQAVQNMNLLFDLPETTGLEQMPLFP